MRRSGFISKAAVAALLLALGAGAYLYLSQKSPKAYRDQSRERVWPVETMQVTFGPLTVRHRLFGEVVAGRRADIRAPVTAEIAVLPDNIRNGAAVAAGDLLYRLDDYDLRLALAETRADRDRISAEGDELQVLSESDAAMLQMDKQDLRFASTDRERVQALAERGRASRKAEDSAVMAENDVKRRLLERRRTLAVTKARLAANEAAMARAEQSILRIQRDIEKAQIKAPFAGVLADVSGAIGKRVQQGDILAHLISLKNREIRFHIPEKIAALSLAENGVLIGRRVNLQVAGGDIRSSRLPGGVSRVAAEVDMTSGGWHAYATFADPLPDSLRPGRFVTIEYETRKFTDVAAVPHSALFDGNVVYVVGTDNRLQPHVIEIVTRLPEQVVIRGTLPEPARVVTTLLAEIAPGLKVQAF